MTVVAFGTSTPELFVTLIAALGGSPDIAVGNVVGSNIANTLLILGVTALISPLAVSRGMVWREMPFGLLASCALLLVAGDAFLDGAAQGVVGPRRRPAAALVLLDLYLLLGEHRAARRRAWRSLAPARGRSLARALALVAAGLAGLDARREVDRRRRRGARADLRDERNPRRAHRRRDRHLPPRARHLGRRRLEGERRPRRSATFSARTSSTSTSCSA